MTIPHSGAADCDCFLCFVEREAEKRMFAGKLGDWDYPEVLVDLLAGIVCSHPENDEVQRRAEHYTTQLLAVVQHQRGVVPFPVRRPGASARPARAAVPARQRARRCEIVQAK